MPNKIVIQKPVNKKESRSEHGGDYEKYLTEMKELGSTDDVDESEPVKQIEKAPAKQPQQPAVSEISNPKKEAQKEMVEDKVIPSVEAVSQMDTKSYSKADLFLLAVNVIALVSLFVMLLNIPKKVVEYNKLKFEIEKLSENPAIGDTQSIRNKEKFDKITGSFLDKTSVVNFVNDIESVKSDGTSISKVSFNSESPVKDRTGNLGYPVVIEFSGNWQRISDDLFAIEELDYLFRPVRIESNKSLLDDNINLDYGGILYVKDLGKN